MCQIAAEPQKTQNIGSSRFPVQIEESGRGRLIDSTQHGYIYNTGEDSHLASVSNDLKQSLPVSNNSLIAQHLRTTSNDWLEQQKLLAISPSALNKHDMISSHDSLSDRLPSHITSYNIGSRDGLSNPIPPISTSPNIYYGTNTQVID